MDKKVVVEGGTKSLDPPCLYCAYSVARHQHTCKNCQEKLATSRIGLERGKKATYATGSDKNTHWNERVKKGLCKTR